MPELVMPKMGDAMEEGTITRWLKKEGDRVQEQEPLAEIETEKASIEIPATEAGVLTRILVQPGQSVPVGAPIAVLDGPSGGASAAASAPAPEQKPAQLAGDKEQTPGAEAPAPRDATADLGRGGGAASSPAGAPQAGAPAAAGEPEGRVKASPLARKVAAEHGIDLRQVRGTGPGGRIIEADVGDALRTGAAPAARPAAPPSPGAAPSAAPAGAETERPMSPMRKVIARRLSESKQTIPHFYVTYEVDMRAAVRLRGEFNAGAGEERRISVNDLVVRACVLALEKFPALNSRLQGDVIKTPSSIHVGVAVALDEGLIVPVIRDAQARSISALGRETRALADRARRGELKPDEYTGGTFTVSNLGMFGVSEFQAVINPPEAAILAVGGIRDTPVVDNGQVVPGKQMSLTLSVDHRLVDGHVAAQFMQEIKRLLEAPLTLFG